MASRRHAEPMHPGANLRRWIDEQCLIAELRADNNKGVAVTNFEAGKLGLAFLGLALTLMPACDRGGLDPKHVEDDLVSRLGEREAYALFNKAHELLEALLATLSDRRRKSCP